MGVIPNPNMAFIFPISCILVLFSQFSWYIFPNVKEKVASKIPNKITVDMMKVIIQNVRTKRHKDEGYNLFREDRVKSLSSNKAGLYIYFRSLCSPKMKYLFSRLYLCFKYGRKTIEMVNMFLSSRNRWTMQTCGCCYLQGYRSVKARPM